MQINLERETLLDNIIELLGEAKDQLHEYFEEEAQQDEDEDEERLSEVIAECEDNKDLKALEKLLDKIKDHIEEIK